MYAEFGVFEGRLCSAAWQAIQRYGPSRVSMHAYESFEGLPAVQRVDEDGPFRTGEYRSPRHVFDAETRKIPAERLTVTEGLLMSRSRGPICFSAGSISATRPQSSPHLAAIPAAITESP
jgi:hypothetical protein